MNAELTNQGMLSLCPDLNGETGAECEIILPDYCPNVLRILQATATPMVTASVRSADRLTVEGNVEYRILYLPEDGSGIQSLSQHAPFSCTLEMRGQEEEYRILTNSRNCTARALNSQKIFVRNTVQITVKRCLTQPVPQPICAKDCETKNCRKRAASLLCTGEKPLRISDDFEVEGGKIPTAILLSKVTFRETEQKPLSDKLIVKADMIFDLLCEEENGGIFPLRKIIPVSQILDLPDLLPDAECRTDFEVLSLSLTVKNEEEPRCIAYDIEINVCARAYTELFAEWTEDAYSVKCNVECVREAVTTEHYLAVEEGGTVRETVDVGTCAEILWADVRPELKTLYYQKETDRLVCEGVWECRVLMNDTEATPCATVREIPFVLEIPADDCTCPVRNDTVLILTDLSWTMTDASHMEIRGSYRWSGLIFGRKTTEIVTGINEKGERERTTQSLVLYYASQGESVWAIAKQHACPYGEIIRHNHLTQDFLEEDRMLIIQNL